MPCPVSLHSLLSLILRVSSDSVDKRVSQILNGHTGTFAKIKVPGRVEEAQVRRRTLRRGISFPEYLWYHFCVPSSCCSCCARKGGWGSPLLLALISWGGGGYSIFTCLEPAAPSRRDGAVGEGGGVYLVILLFITAVSFV